MSTAPPNHSGLARHVTVWPSGASFEVQPGESVLEAGLRAGLRMPRSCRNGSCRACLCYLSQGQVRYRIDWPSLSPDDRDEGAMLPCVALPESDLVLQAPAVLGPAPEAESPSAPASPT